MVADQQKLQKTQKQIVVKTVTKENTEKHKNTDAEPVQCNWFKRTADRDHGDWLLDKEAFDEVRQPVMVLHISEWLPQQTPCLERGWGLRQSRIQRLFSKALFTC